MRHTVLDGKQWILEVLLKAKISISGNIYKDKRPMDSLLEDIVINSLTMTNEYMQNGVFNVNCYVPTLSVKNRNGIVQKQKNAKRLKAIADEVYQALNQVWEEDFILEIENHQEFEDDDFHYINFRINLITI